MVVGIGRLSPLPEVRKMTGTEYTTFCYELSISMPSYLERSKGRARIAAFNAGPITGMAPTRSEESLSDKPVAEREFLISI